MDKGSTDGCLLGFLAFAGLSTAVFFFCFGSFSSLYSVTEAHGRITKHVSPLHEGPYAGD